VRERVPLLADEIVSRRLAREASFL